MDTDNLKKFEQILSLLDDSLTRKDFEKAFGTVVEFVKKIDENNQSELETIKNIANSAISRIQSLTNDNLSTLENTLRLEAEQAINDLRFQHEALVAEAQEKLDGVKDGIDGVNGKDGTNGVNGKDGSPDTPDQVLEKVNTSKTLIKKERVEGLQELEYTVRNRTGGGNRSIYVNGQMANNIVFQGTAFASAQVVGETAYVTHNGGTGGGGILVETPTGDVNGVNVSYTVANTPIYIIVDGISKFETLHYNYSGGTITLIDDAPPTQYIRSLYSAS